MLLQDALLEKALGPWLIYFHEEAQYKSRRFVLRYIWIAIDNLQKSTRLWWRGDASLLANIGGKRHSNDRCAIIYSNHDKRSLKLTLQQRPTGGYASVISGSEPIHQALFRIRNRLHAQDPRPAPGQVVDSRIRRVLFLLVTNTPHDHLVAI